jgi:hypothetical protein
MRKRRSGSNPASAALRSAATALKTQEALGAAASVIAARTEMAALALANPTAEAGAELQLMVTEKVAAFSEAGAAMAAGAQAMVDRGARFAADEAAAAGRSVAQLSACSTPLEAMTVQSRLMVDFFDRSLAYGLGLNTLMARTGDRVLAPVHKAVTANDRRLKKAR